MDISALNVEQAADDGVEIELVHPGTQEPLGITMRIIGQDSDIYQRLQARYQREAMTRLQRSFSGRRLGAEDEDVSTRQEIEICVACTVGWANLEENGTPVEFTPANARRIYSTPGYRWMREQVRAAIGDRALFLKRSATP